MATRRVPFIHVFLQMGNPHSETSCFTVLFFTIQALIIEIGSYLGFYL